MTDKLCKGVCQIWDNTNGTGWIFLDDDSGAATVCKDDLNGASLKKGDHVEFYIRDQNGSKKAIRVRKCKEKLENKTGILYFQKHFYDKKQMQNINNIFGMNTNKGPKMLFGDDYNEKFRSKHKNRQRFGGQSMVMGHWDRKYGFGIPTSFDSSKSLGFIHNDHNFKNLMKTLFKELKIHLANGGDVIIPYPTTKDVNQRKQKYFKSGSWGWASSGKQIIHHNIGTGISSLSFNQLEIIQQHIDELKPLASEIKHVDQVSYTKNETNHYEYERKNNEMNHDQLSTGNPKSSRGLLIFQTDWYNKQQMQRIHNFYREQNTIEKAPKMLFGDNDSDKARPKYKNRQFFGGMAGVMGQYDQSFSYGIVTTFFQNKTPNNMQFQRLMNTQFKPLKNHLLNGYDVVIPKPSESEIRKNKHRYFRYGKQVIFHNIGTGIASLPFDFLKYIQTKIDELKKIAKNELTVKYYKCQSSFNKPNHSNQHNNDEKEQNALTYHNSNNNTYTTENWYCKGCSRVLVLELNDELCSFCMKAKPKQNKLKKMTSKYAKQYEISQALEAENEKLKSDKMKNGQQLNDKMQELQNINSKFKALTEHSKMLQSKTKTLNVEVIQMKNNEKELEEKLLRLENENSELKKINKSQTDKLKNNYAVDPIVEYKSNNKNDIKIRDNIVEKQSGIDNLMNVHLNRLSKWDECTVNLQKEFEKIKTLKNNDNDEKKQQQNEMTIPVSDLLNSYVTCRKWLKIQQSRLEGIVEHVVLLSRSKKELKNIVKQYEENVKPTQQKYDQLIASYTNLKSERIKLREKVSNMIQQINQITQEENKINKEKYEMLNNLHECVTEKEKYDQLLVKCKSLTTKYNEFEKNIDAKVEELNHFFKQNWDNHEKIWWKWNVNDIICWLKYMIYSNKIISSQELDLNNVAKEMEIQKFTGKSLPKIEKSDLKLFGIILFDDYQQIYKQIQIIINKYPNIVDKDDIGNNDVEGGVQITLPKVQIPEEFKCPISDQIMVDPIVYDGITYDRNNFMEYVQKHKTLPGSNEEYDEDEGLFKNRKLKQKIDVFLDVNPQFRIDGV